MGGYKCECKQGFEYPFEDLTTYFDGQLMEAEFNNIVSDNETRYLMCLFTTSDEIITKPL